MQAIRIATHGHILCEQHMQAIHIATHGTHFMRTTHASHTHSHTWDTFYANITSGKSTKLRRHHKADKHLASYKQLKTINETIQ